MRQRIGLMRTGLAVVNKVRLSLYRAYLSSFSFSLVRKKKKKKPWAKCTRFGQALAEEQRERNAHKGESMGRRPGWSSLLS